MGVGASLLDQGMRADIDAVVVACPSNEGVSVNSVLQSVRDHLNNRATTNSMMPIGATFQTSERASGTPPKQERRRLRYPAV